MRGGMLLGTRGTLHESSRLRANRRTTRALRARRVGMTADASSSRCCSCVCAVASGSSVCVFGARVMPVCECDGGDACLSILFSRPLRHTTVGEEQPHHGGHTPGTTSGATRSSQRRTGRACPSCFLVCSVGVDARASVGAIVSVRCDRLTVLLVRGGLSRAG